MTAVVVAAMVLVMILGSVMVGLVLVVLNATRDVQLDSPDDLDDWRRTTAEVVSIWGRRDQTFVRVRYRVGGSVIENDVPCSLSGATLRAGHRVLIRYHPMHPARVVLDLAGPGEPPGPPRSGASRSRNS